MSIVEVSLRFIVATTLITLPRPTELTGIDVVYIFWNGMLLTHVLSKEG